MLLSIQSEVLRVFQELSALTEHRRRSGIRESMKVQRLGRRMSLAMEQLAMFIAECNELNTLTDNKVPASKMTDIYELLPRTHRARLEDAVQAKSLPSSILKFNQLDSIFFIANVALATAEWDTVIHQAWRLNVEAESRIKSATSRWRDEFMILCDNRQKHKPERRMIDFHSFDTELVGQVDDGLYKTPESSELDALLKKESRKVSLL